MHLAVPILLKSQAFGQYFNFCVSFLGQLEMQAVTILEPFWRRCSVILFTAPHTSERRQGELCQNAKRSGAKITKGKTVTKSISVCLSL